MRSLVSAVVAAALAMACTPGSTTAPASAPPAPATPGITEQGPITLTVWDQESGAVSRIWDQLNAQFEQKYPNVTIDRVQRNLGTLKTLTKLAISGEDAPDVVEVNQGWPDMGSMVRAGLLLPLDNYAKAYGWFDRVPENVNAANSFTSDGTQFGTGSLFGFTNEGELIGVFYNKTIMSRLGLSVPTTLAGFEHDLAVAKQAAEIPIQFGVSDQWPGIHEYAVVQDQVAPEGYLTDLIFGLQGEQLSFDTPQNVQAATILQDWADKGYFTPGFEGVTYQDALNDFAKGEGLFEITGNWAVADLGADSTDFGFFLMPPMQPGGPLVSTGAPGYPLSIPAKSKHPDAAAAYIDWMTSDHAQRMLVQTGQIPLAKDADTSSVRSGTLLAEVLEAATELNASNGLVPYEDWATPTFYDTLVAAIQELMASRLTPKEFVEKIEADYQDFQSSRT